MSDYDLPELPSDDELGITDEDRERLDEELPQDRPELSQEEMVALLGRTFSEKEAGGTGKESGETPTKKGRNRPEAPAAGMPEGPRTRWKGPVTLVLLVGVAVFSSSRTGLPDPVPANASDTVFASSRAMSMLVEIAREPHPPGSPEHARVREYLMGRLRSLGLEPEVQTASSMIQETRAARVATVRNVLARIPGTASTGAVLVTAHYDSRELSPGAGDDASGVAAILEALRALQTRNPLRNDVIVLFTDAEELGLLGARAFVGEHPWLADVALVLSFEMRGSGGPSIMFETNDENGWVVRALDAFDPHPFANSLGEEVYRRIGRDTDFTPFKEAGKQGLNFAAIDNVHVYHQSLDTPENLSESTLQHHGLRALAGLEHFGGADLSDVRAPDVVYFTVPVLGLVVYGGGWVLAVSGGLLVLLALAVGLARRARARPAGVAAGFTVAALGAGLSYAGALGLMRWIPQLHPEAASLEASLYHSEGWYVLALVAVTFAIVTALHALARRRLSVIELTLGGVLAPLALAIVLGFAAPFGAMNLQWPVAAALLAAVVVELLGTRASGLVAWIASALLAGVVLVMLVPVVELLWIAMSLEIAGGFALLVAMTLHLCLPTIEALRHPNAWWAPLVGLGVAGVALGIGVLVARPSADRPAPSTLVYLYEHGSGSPLWATDPAADPELDAEARAWAAERAGSAFSEMRDLSAFGYDSVAAPVTEAPAVTAPPPQVSVLVDTIGATARRVVLGFRSLLGAEMMRFQRDPTSGTRILAVNGDAVLEPDSLRWVEHWGEPDSLVVLELGAPVDEPIGLHVVEHLLRPEELLGVTPFERPPDLAPDVSTMSDRALLRFSVAAFADPRHSLFPLSDGESSGGEPPSAQLEPAAADSSGVGGPRGAEPADTSGAEDAAEDSAEPPPADTTLAPTPGGR